ncbi:MAG: glycoside hydrolase family 70 protein [Streptococcus thermophilus]
MKGYLGVWVPVGAPDNQDIRVKGSDKKLDKTFLLLKHWTLSYL